LHDLGIELFVAELGKLAWPAMLRAVDDPAEHLVRKGATDHALSARLKAISPSGDGDLYLGCLDYRQLN
jgi:hypothetical protein